MAHAKLRPVRRARPFAPHLATIPPSRAASRATVGEKAPKLLDAPRSDLFVQLCDRATLLAAWRALRKGRTQQARRFAGTADRVSLDAFERNLEANVSKLRAELQSGQYRPDPIVHFRIPKPGGTQRTLTLYTVRDRLVQRAALGLLEPLFEPDFLACSYGYRPNRGTGDALAAVNAAIADGYVWAVDADIASFFDTVDRARLAGLVAARISDPRLKALVLLWLHDPQIAAPHPKAEATSPALSQTLAEAAQTSLVGGLDWGIGSLAGRGGALYSGGVEDDGDDDAENAGGLPAWVGAPRLPDTRDMRHEALRRLGADGALLGLALARGLLKQGGTKAAVRGALKTGAALGTAGVALAVARELWGRRSPANPATFSDPYFVGAERRGIAQGAILSPLYANVYLHAFDVAMTGRGLRLVRFADDLLILCRSEREAEAALMEAERVLGEMGLAFNPAKTGVRQIGAGFGFLGATRNADNTLWETPTQHTVSATEWLAHAGWLKTSRGRGKGVGQKP